jgi:glycosyltransferase involved in cell wall biosynthesis
MIRKKLLVVSSTYPRWTGDPEPAFVHELSKRLTQEFEVHVVCPHSVDALVYELLDGVHVHRFRYAPNTFETLVSGGGILSNLKSNRWKYLLVIPYLIGLAWALLKIVRKNQPDVIHAHWIIPQGFVLAVMSIFVKLPPMLLTSHGGDLFSVDSFLMRFFKRYTLKKFKKITIVSAAMVTKIESLGVNSERTNVIPMGVDLSNLFIPNDKINRISNRILFVGRIVEKKGLIYLIKALSKVKVKFPDAHLIIAGAGSVLEENKIRKEIAERNLVSSVTWLGAVSQMDLPQLYCESEVFVAPFVEAESGDQEGLGLVAIEAIGCLCPIVLGRVSAVDEFYKELDLSPALVNPYNVDELANAIENVFETPYFNYDLIFRLREKIHNRLSWSIISNKYCTEIKDLVI